MSVPWPEMTSTLLYGWTKVAPVALRMASHVVSRASSVGAHSVIWPP